MNDLFTLQSKPHISVLLVNGLYCALMTGLMRSLCNSRSAAGKSKSRDMAKRKINSAGWSWMVALMLLCNLSEVKLDNITVILKTSTKR